MVGCSLGTHPCQTRPLVSNWLCNANFALRSPWEPSGPKAPTSARAALNASWMGLSSSPSFSTCCLRTATSGAFDCLEERQEEEPMSFYSERMWCRACNDYVNYLQSTESCYCVRCGNKVQFFKDEDIRRIRRLLGTASGLKKKRSKAS